MGEDEVKITAARRRAASPSARRRAKGAKSGDRHQNPHRPKAVKWKKFLPLYLMMVPGIAYLIVNNYLPMSGLIIAFKDLNFRKGILGSDWIGLKNFEYLFATSDAWLITRNTLLYNVVFIALNNFLGVAVAILLNDLSSRRMKKFYQSAVLLPYLISMIIISYLVNAFLSSDLGFVNRTLLPALGQTGPPGTPRPRCGRPSSYS